MFNTFNNKNLIQERLLDLSRDITNYVTMFRDISDMLYLMKINDIQSRFSSIVGYQNSSASSMLSSKITMLNYDKSRTNAIKLLELSNAILELGRYLR